MWNVMLFFAVILAVILVVLQILLCRDLSIRMDRYSWLVKTHDSLLIGTKLMCDLDNTDLLSLSKSLFAPFPGSSCGCTYSPSADIRIMISAELDSRRRKLS